ncbi:MAG: isoprenylcysteine carboxylmethyltransferase family protein [Lapillicoccus sp.]
MGTHLGEWSERPARAAAPVLRARLCRWNGVAGQSISALDGHQPRTPDTRGGGRRPGSGPRRDCGRPRPSAPQHGGPPPRGRRPHHDGPFRLSRNPMYAGLAVAYVGGALLAASWWPLLTLPAALLAVRTLVIAPEERYLATRFSDSYPHHSGRTRRWV